jgi:hypothetical protein
MALMRGGPPRGASHQQPMRVVRGDPYARVYASASGGQGVTMLRFMRPPWRLVQIDLR